MAGPHLVRWHDFVTLTEGIISPLFKPSLDSLVDSSSIDPSISDYGSDHWQSPNREKSLFELLRITSKDFACSDPKDRIFALIGISNDPEISIQVDYARTTEEVYTEAFEYFINTEGNVDMLLDGRLSRQNDPLPTWIPQFATIKTTKEAGTPNAFRASSEKPVTEIIHREPSTSCGCTGSCLKLRGIKFDKIVRRVAIAAEHGTLDNIPIKAMSRQPYHPPTQDIHVYRLEAVSSGDNSDRLSHPLRTTVKTKSIVVYSRWSVRDRTKFYAGHRPYGRHSFLDCMLEALNIDLAQPPRLKLERLPQIGLLFSDYLYNGTQSLGTAMMYYHDLDLQNCRGWQKDWSLAHTEMVQRHRLPQRQAFLQDLELAMAIQFRVLEKSARSERTSHGGGGPGHEVPGISRSPDSGYERVFFKTEDQHLGVGPGVLQIGDEVVVPFGSSRPWVLRSHGDHHVLVGEAFVPGIMTGQLEELWRSGDLEYTDYFLR
jgi:hypothetical protein